MFKNFENLYQSVIDAAYDSEPGINLFALFKISVLIIISIILYYVIKISLNKFSIIDEGKKYSIIKLIKYVIIVLAFEGILDFIGFDMRFILAGSAAFIFVIALGLQNIISDIISGLILLLDSTIKVGDIIEHEDNIYKIKNIKFRYVTLSSPSKKNIFVPNSIFTKSKFINRSRAGFICYLAIDIRVDYNQDIDQISKIILNICSNNDKIIKTPHPIVLVNDFGEWYVLLTLKFCTKNFFNDILIKSDLRKDILKELKQRNIKVPTIPSPIYMNKEK